MVVTEFFELLPRLGGSSSHDWFAGDPTDYLQIWDQKKHVIDPSQIFFKEALTTRQNTDFKNLIISRFRKVPKSLVNSTVSAFFDRPDKQKTKACHSPHQQKLP